MGMKQEGSAAIELLALISYNLVIMRLQNNKPRLSDESKRSKSIIGHTKILDLLQRGVKNNSVAHAYVFLGPARIGKNTVAKWLARQLLNDFEGSFEAHPNVSLVRREYDEKKKKLKSKISIEHIRALRERLGMSTFGQGWKVAIIEEAETMSLDAANALLKTLEEPSGQTTVILIASSENGIPATIFSRAQVIYFNLVPNQEIKLAFQDDVLVDELVAHAAGRPGVAISMKDDAEDFEARRQTEQEFWQLLEGTLSERMAAAARLPKGVSAREDVRAKLNRFEVKLRELLLMASGCDELVSSAQAKRLAGKDSNHWKKALQTLSECRSALEANTNPQLVLENFLIKL